MDKTETAERGQAGRRAGPHHAGGGSSSSSADHHTRNVAAPVSLALLVGQQWQSSLLQLVGSAGSCGRQSIQNIQTGFFLPVQTKSTVARTPGSRLDGFCLTIVAGQAPARGDAGHSSCKDVGGLSKADGGHIGAHAGGAGQLDEGDVIVDGAGVPLGVGEDLVRRRMLGQISQERWRDPEADWTMGVSHLGGLQNLDSLVGAIGLIVFSSDHTVVGPDREQDASLQKHINRFIHC